MQPNKDQNRLFIGLAILLLVAVSGTWLGNRSRNKPAQPQQTNAMPVVANVAVQTSSPPAITATSPASPPSEPPRKVQDIFSTVKSAPDAATARRRLAELQGALAAMPKDAAVSAIRQFLDSRADAPTHLGFKVAGTGLLDDAPTLRTFLLDQLGRLDPAAAAEYSKVILAGMDSSDEWAVALRNLARGDNSPGARALLEQKTADLLRYAPWQQDPSSGYLEAFDVAVYLQSTNLLPPLTDLVRRQDNPAVAHASYLALDRLVINTPTDTLGVLGSDPSLMQGRELTRADYFARADVRDPQQRQVLENYLLNPQIGPAELNQFAGLFPNANYMISANLLTPTPTPDHAALIGRDAASMAALQQWLNDPRFANLRPQLDKAKMRLDDFIRQENAH